MYKSSVAAQNSAFWPRGYQTFFMLNSSEHDFFLLINVEMLTNDGILKFISEKKNIQGLSEPKTAEFLDTVILMSI